MEIKLSPHLIISFHGTNVKLFHFLFHLLHVGIQWIHIVLSLQLHRSVFFLFSPLCLLLLYFIVFFLLLPFSILIIVAFNWC